MKTEEEKIFGLSSYLKQVSDRLYLTPDLSFKASSVSDSVQL